MEEDFSLSVQGADIQTKMPLTTPPALGISVLNLLKSDPIPSNSQSFSEHLIIRRGDVPKTLLNLSHKDLNIFTPKASLNQQTHTSDQFSLDKEIGILNENKKRANTENSKANYTVSDKIVNPTQSMGTNHIRNSSNAINILQRYKLINRAINNLKNRTSFRTPKNLDSKQLGYINDPSNFQKKISHSFNMSRFLDSNLLPYKPYQKFLMRNLSNFSHFCKFFIFFPLFKIFSLLTALTLHPYNRLKLFFEMMRFFIVLYFFFEFSIELSFEFDTREKHSLLTKILIIFVLIVEFLINCGITRNNPNLLELIPNKKKPTYNYHILLSKTLGLLSFIFYFALPYNQPTIHLNLLIIFYYSECSETLEFWTIALKTTEFYENFIDLILIIIKFFMLLHLLACVGAYIVFFVEDQGIIILKKEGFIIETYLYSLIVTFRLFFLDLSESNDVKLMFKHFFMLILWILLFFTIFIEFGVKFWGLGNKTQRKLNPMNQYLKLNSMNFQFRMSFKKYLNFFEKQALEKDMTKSMQVINSLNHPLRKEVLENSEVMYIPNYSRIFGRFSKQTIKKFIQKLKYKLIRPGEDLFNQGDLNPSLYLVISGAIDLSITNRITNKPFVSFKTVQKNDCINEFELITGNPHRFSARSTDFSSVMELTREDFLNILRNNRSDYESFCMIHDQITLYNDFSSLMEVCQGCSERSHRLEMCPIIHYIPFKDFLIQRHIYNSVQKRKGFERRLKKRRNSLFFSAQNRYFALQITYDNKEKKSEDENEMAYQEQSSILYPSDYSLESEDDFSEEDFNKNNLPNLKFKSTNTLPSIKRDKIDSLEVIDEESKSRSGTVIVNNNKSNGEIGLNPNSMGIVEDKFTSKLLDTKAFDTKRQISATEIKIESKIMTEGGKLFEDYLKRNSLLSKQSSIGKRDTTSLSEFATKSNNPHYKNSNAVLSLTENKSSGVSGVAFKRRNSIMMGTMNTNNTNTGTKSNKSSKVSKNVVFDMFMDFDNLAIFEGYFPENNCQNIVAKLQKNMNKSKNNRSRYKKGTNTNNDTNGGKSEDDRSFRFVNTLDSKDKTQKKSHFISFKKKGKKTSIEKKSSTTEKPNLNFDY